LLSLVVESLSARCHCSWRQAPGGERMSIVFRYSWVYLVWFSGGISWHTHRQSYCISLLDNVKKSILAVLFWPSGSRSIATYRTGLRSVSLLIGFCF